MAKITYVVQYQDGEDVWRSTFGYRSDTLSQGLSELELHEATYPEVPARLVKLETTTKIQDIILTEPKAP